MNANIHPLCLKQYKANDDITCVGFFIKLRVLQIRISAENLPEIDAVFNHLSFGFGRNPAQQSTETDHQRALPKTES